MKLLDKLRKAGEHYRLMRRTHGKDHVATELAFERYEYVANQIKIDLCLRRLNESFAARD